MIKFNHIKPQKKYILSLKNMCYFFIFYYFLCFSLASQNKSPFEFSIVQQHLIYIDKSKLSLK